MNIPHCEKKINFLIHRIGLIQERLKKNQGADVKSLEDALRHFTEMHKDYKNIKERLIERQQQKNA